METAIPAPPRNSNSPTISSREAATRAVAASSSAVNAEVVEAEVAVDNSAIAITGKTDDADAINGDAADSAADSRTHHAVSSSNNNREPDRARQSPPSFRMARPQGGLIRSAKAASFAGPRTVI
jgi:hypothetical protein